MPVTIQNKAKRMLVFNLPHAIVCEDTDGGCACTRQTVGIQDHNAKTGEKTVRAHRRRLAASITMLAAGHEGDTLEGLPNGVARVPEVAQAKARGEIVISLSTVKPAPTASTEPARDAKKAASAAVKE